MLIGGQMIRSLLSVLLLGTLAMSTTACLGDGYKAVNEDLLNANGDGLGLGGPTPGSPVDDSDVDMTELNQKLTDVEGEISAVTSQMNGLTILSLTANQTPGSSALGTDFRVAFERLLNAVSEAKDQVAILSLEVEGRLAQLDPLNPVHAEIITRLTEALTYLNQVPQLIDDQILQLVDLIDLGVNEVDVQVADLDANDPLTWVAATVWEGLKLVIFEYRARLLEVVG